MPSFSMRSIPRGDPRGDAGTTDLDSAIRKEFQERDEDDESSAKNQPIY